MFDADSIGMAAVQRRLNCGIDLGGQAIDPQTCAVIGVGLDPTALDQRRELDRFRQKVEAGAEFAITQPVFDPDALLRMLDEVQPLGIPIIAGIWPLVSYRNALFMRNEVPGVVVPDAVHGAHGRGAAARSNWRWASSSPASRSPASATGWPAFRSAPPWQHRHRLGGARSGIMLDCRPAAKYGFKYPPASPPDLQRKGPADENDLVVHSGMCGPDGLRRAGGRCAAGSAAERHRRADPRRHRQRRAPRR